MNQEHIDYLIKGHEDLEVKKIYINLAQGLLNFVNCVDKNSSEDEAM